MGDQITETFETPQGCDLVVENVRGAIVVEGWDKPTTEVVADTRKGEPDIEIVQDGRRVEVRTKYERGVLDWLDWLFKGNTPVVDYTVHVPFASNLKLKNVSGPIHASGVQGTVKINNVDGTARLDEIAGKVKAETVNGSLHAHDLRGNAKLSTVNGQMKVQSGALDGLRADTVNGDISIASTLSASGDYVLHTVNGSCHVAVQEGFRAHVEAHGVNVSVDCKVPAESVDRSFGNWRGTIGTGDGPIGKIRFDTVNGKLHIGAHQQAPEAGEPFVAKAEPAPEPPKPPEPPVPPPAPPPAGEKPSQAEILAMVERGEISVDKALELLKG
jgi:hypothetical protein